MKDRTIKELYSATPAQGILQVSVSGWVRTSGHQRDVGRDAAEAVAAARATPNVIATLMLPADVSWSEGGVVSPARERLDRAPVGLFAHVPVTRARTRRDAVRAAPDGRRPRHAGLLQQ